jgi:cystathionine beta-lyase/cystathionine gamma-synthase
MLATWLEGRAGVSDVRYPGLASHPQHELAARQMSAGGGLIAFDVDGGVDAGRRFVEAVEIAQLATSLGGPETLVTHPASTTHVGLTPAELAANGIGQGTIRLSVGLEAVEDLIADLDRALDVAAAGTDG